MTELMIFTLLNSVALLLFLVSRMLFVSYHLKILN